MKRGYQYHFSKNESGMFSIAARQRKAKTMIAVLDDYIDGPLTGLSVLNVGGSAGIIDDYLSDHFASVIGIDIDETAIEYARKNYSKRNLKFAVGDAMNLQFEDNAFDVVISSHVYEHVPDAATMMDEIYRVLKPNGVCYFAAGNRLMWNEPHYNIPLLSVIPRPFAHFYLKLLGKGDFYYEKHLSYWGLKKLTGKLDCVDYTLKIIQNPRKYAADYMITPGTIKARLAVLITKYIFWLIPGYIWLLKKPDYGR